MTTQGTPQGGWPLDLLDWKRRVAAMYAAARTGGGGEATLTAFRGDKDALFATHPQSPIPGDDRAGFTGLRYFPHRPDMRCEVELDPDPDGPELLLPSSTDEPFRFRLIGRVTPVAAGQPVSLGVYWLTSYGGGLFLPFRDATAGRDTYGAGRYLLDTVKGADLGATGGGRIVVDFNYAYNPSCSYDPAWSCPLSPPENRLEIAIEAGERLWAPAL